MDEAGALTIVRFVIIQTSDVLKRQSGITHAIKEKTPDCSRDSEPGEIIWGRTAGAIRPRELDMEGFNLYAGEGVGFEPPAVGVPPGLSPGVPESGATGSVFVEPAFRLE